MCECAYTLLNECLCVDVEREGEYMCIGVNPYVCACASANPLRASVVTGGGSETRMLPRPRISPVRVNLPPKQDVRACRYAIYNVAYANDRRDDFLK